MKAREFLPELISDANALVISPVSNSYGQGEKLGHLVVFPNCQAILNSSHKYEGRPLSIKQKEYGILGSFLFIGTNPNVFNPIFFNNIFTGKYTSRSDSTIILDERYAGMISVQFHTIIIQYLGLYGLQTNTKGFTKMGVGA